MLNAAKRDHSLPALGEVAQITCDVAADLNLHGGLAKVDVAAVVQFKAHHVLHNPREARSDCVQRVSRSGVIREVAQDGQRSASPAALEDQSRRNSRHLGCRPVRDFLRCTYTPGDFPSVQGLLLHEKYRAHPQAPLRDGGRQPG
jgi:hypothetical protein